MNLIKTYTISQSWENDTLGNAVNVYNTFFKEYSDAAAQDNVFNLWFAIFENNNASNTSYKVDYCYLYRKGSGSTGDFVTIRNNRTNGSSGISSQRSLWASAGTVVKVYSLY